MTDLIERLRAVYEDKYCDQTLFNEAADRIEELEAENARLLNRIAELGSYLDEEREKNEKQVRMTMDLRYENERLRELTTNDKQEIGSYRKGTGLRGENRALEAQVEALQNKCARRGLSPEDSDALEAENARLLNRIAELGSYLDEEREKNEKQVRMTMDSQYENAKLREALKAIAEYPHPDSPVGDIDRAERVYMQMQNIASFGLAAGKDRDG
jgi:hypothetical protein